MSHLATSLSQSLAQSLASSIGGGEFLSFLRGTYANASPRNFFAKNPSSGLYEMTGPFAANTLATRKIGGHGYGLFEGEYSTKNTYSEVFRAAISDWDNLGDLFVSDDQTTSPIGDNTADLLYEGTDTNLRYLRQNFTPDGSSKYWSLQFLKKKERYKGNLYFLGGGGFPASNAAFDLDAKTLTPAGSAEDAVILELETDWYFCAFSATSNAAAATQYRIYMYKDDGSSSWLGDGSSGLYIWGANIIKAEHLTSYIQAIASPVTKAKDVFYWANAALPSWLKGSQNIPFTFNFIPNYSSTQHAASAVDTFLFSVDGTENVECYIAGSDQKLYIDVDSVNKFTSASAFAWDLHDTCQVTVIPNNGSNCRVITSGFNSGNADETGTSFSMQNDGDLYWAMRHTTNDLQLDGIQSEPRKGLV